MNVIIITHYNKKMSRVL